MLYVSYIIDVYDLHYRLNISFIEWTIKESFLSIDTGDSRSYVWKEIINALVISMVAYI